MGREHSFLTETIEQGTAQGEVGGEITEEYSPDGQPAENGSKQADGQAATAFGDLWPNGDDRGPNSQCQGPEEERQVFAQQDGAQLMSAKTGRLKQGEFRLPFEHIAGDQQGECGGAEDEGHAAEGGENLQIGILHSLQFGESFAGGAQGESAILKLAGEVGCDGWIS